MCCTCVFTPLPCCEKAQQLIQLVVLVVVNAETEENMRQRRWNKKKRYERDAIPDNATKTSDSNTYNEMNDRLEPPLTVRGPLNPRTRFSASTSMTVHATRAFGK